MDVLGEKGKELEGLADGACCSDAPDLGASATGLGIGSRLCSFKTLIVSDHPGLQA